MTIIVIVSVIFIVWAAGNFLLDRWINNGMEDANEDQNKIK